MSKLANACERDGEVYSRDDVGLDGQLTIWRWYDGRYVVHVEDRAFRDRMLRWKGTYQRAVEWGPNGYRAWQVVIPGDLVDRVRKLSVDENDG